MAAGLAFAVVAVAAPSSGQGAASARPARTTVDPQPPMALTLEVTGLEKQARGGIATVLLKVGAEVGVDRAVVTARVPGDLRFADGSRVKVIDVDLSTGGGLSVPVDILVPRDGKFTMTAELEGTAHGRALRRDAATTLFVGRHDAGPQVRDGAIEYAAEEAAATGEVQP
ncbi:MAG TPA: hypothetical protein VJV75_01930 [Candidatus Polarisedimenticolia bacterium]|nr:hypothetical protein [Candidatus Polarisedimenticolia bacterium]